MENVVIYGAVYVSETEREICIEYEGGEVRLPKAQIDYDQSVEKGGLTDVEVPQWLAVKKGWCER